MIRSHMPCQKVTAESYAVVTWDQMLAAFTNYDAAASSVWQQGVFYSSSSSSSASPPPPPPLLVL